jgi:hypothetical protein
MFICALIATPFKAWIEGIPKEDFSRKAVWLKPLSLNLSLPLHFQVEAIKTQN